MAIPGFRYCREMAAALLTPIESKIRGVRHKKIAEHMPEPPPESFRRTPGAEKAAAGTRLLVAGRAVLD